MTNSKILAFSGSTRKDSVNEKLLSLACSIASTAGAFVTQISLADFELPIFNQDLESAGFPENAVRLKDLFKQHSGLLLACPEYNSSFTPLLKNTIDWVSRPTGDEKPLAAYSGKTACLVSASPGALGGLRGLRHVREILSNISVLVTPNQFALSAAHSAFTESGQLNDARQVQRLSDCITEFVGTNNRQSNRTGD